MHYKCDPADGFPPFPGPDALRGLAESVLGDLLRVRLKTFWWWSTGMTLDLALLRGLGQIMYDFSEQPDLIHRLMAVLPGIIGRLRAMSPL